jgi:hypothetical protein
VGGGWSDGEKVNVDTGNSARVSLARSSMGRGLAKFELLPEVPGAKPPCTCYVFVFENSLVVGKFAFRKPNTCTRWTSAIQQ